MAPAMMADSELYEMIARRASPLLVMSAALARKGFHPADLTRPLLGEMLWHATYMEELLDACGARDNRRWQGFRSSVAALKVFADIGYESLHVKWSLPIYRLLPIEEDFTSASDAAVAFVAEVLRRASRCLLNQAAELDLAMPTTEPREGEFDEDVLPGRLPRDRELRRVEKVSETVANLATAFLNLAADNDAVRLSSRVTPEEYASCVPDMLSEESLRALQNRFHNIQSLYDTFVSDTEAEHLDADLPVLRGHVSVVYHLLKIATNLVHYYERHVDDRRDDASAGRKPLATSAALLRVLMEYAVAFAGRYIVCARRLCQDMLKRYAEIVRIEVPVPRYRGFHVRPSTLVAKIVLHYGSDVQMSMDDESFDAGSPMDIFRANEKINARKRRWLAEEIAKLPLLNGDGAKPDIKTVVSRVIAMLAEQDKLVLYELPIRLPDELQATSGTLLENVIDEMARLQATGKIDIDTDLNVTVVGDKRVLADIELLAKHGYGEDNFGNNIRLPDELAYLRR